MIITSCHHSSLQALFSARLCRSDDGHRLRRNGPLRGSAAIYAGKQGAWEGPSSAPRNGGAVLPTSSRSQHARLPHGKHARSSAPKQTRLPNLLKRNRSALHTCLPDLLKRARSALRARMLDQPQSIHRGAFPSKSDDSPQSPGVNVKRTCSSAPAWRLGTACA